MFIAGTESVNMMRLPVDLLPLRVRKYFFGTDCGTLYEIRLRCGLPLGVTTERGKLFVTKNNRLVPEPGQGVIMTRRDIDEAVELLTESSLYSYHDELKHGFVTAYGGHRVGVCGTVTNDGDFIKDISGLNYRFAKEIKGCALPVFEKIFDNGKIRSTLIVSPPGCGKTTVLRDLIRLVSNLGTNVSIVDERGEIASVYDGVSCFDLGVNTDVMSLCSKYDGMKNMLRTMSPQVIAMDELGYDEDFEAVREANISGVRVFATMHCRDWKNDIPPQILKGFRCVVVLSDRKGPGTVEECVYV